MTFKVQIPKHSFHSEITWIFVKAISTQWHKMHCIRTAMFHQLPPNRRIFTFLTPFLPGLRWKNTLSTATFADKLDEPVPSTWPWDELTSQGHAEQKCPGTVQQCRMDPEGATRCGLCMYAFFRTDLIDDLHVWLGLQRHAVTSELMKAQITE